MEKEQEVKIAQSNIENIQISNKHKLNSTWVFWYTSRKEKDYPTPYAERLTQLISFSTLEDFFKYYVYIKSASEVERNSDLSLFKEGYKPLWENCSNGGCLFFRFRKQEEFDDLDNKWEKLVFALIGINIFY